MSTDTGLTHNTGLCGPLSPDVVEHKGRMGKRKPQDAADYASADNTMRFRDCVMCILQVQLVATQDAHSEGTTRLISLSLSLSLSLSQC
jgi:hypothetical protein